MKIALVTDTWNNVNGVVRTLKTTVKQLEDRGHQVSVIHPGLFKTISVKSYPEIKLSWNIWKVGPMLNDINPDAIHIATEGPLGLAARWYCKVDKRSIPHNTSYHTKFPEYLKIHYHVPLKVGYYFMRMFHKFSTKVLVTTQSMKDELEKQGFKNLIIWSRGVDKAEFSPQCRCKNLASKPILLCVSRVSKEKGIDEFCSIRTTGTKILVGDGPYLEEIKKKYPDVIYPGYKHGKSLEHYYANSDVTVFPSKTDTFGIVMLESMACGTPVASYPVTGPLDVITPNVNGIMNSNLEVAIEGCLTLDRKEVEKSSHQFSWSSCTDIFENNLALIH
jgi:glycosyltransferase involved in cell wall biosynthesis